MATGPEPASAVETGDGRLSWDRGPANSRFVRLLFYPATGVLGGLILGFVGLFSPGFVSRLSEGLPPWLLAGLAVALAFFAPILWASVRTNRVQRERFRLAREWHDVTVSRWSLLAALLVGGLLVGAGWRFDWSLETFLGVGYAGLLAGTILAVLAGFFGSAGEIDPEALTLSYAGRDDVDLRRLADVKRVSVGRYTVLWLMLSESGGTRSSGGGRSRGGRSGQDLYAMPTEVVERARPVFERGMAADAGTGVEQRAEKSNVLRNVNVFVAVVFVGGAGGVLAFLVGIGAPAWQVVQWLWVTLGVAYFFLRFLARTV